MLGHKLKPIGDLERIRYIYRGPIGGDIYNTTADARPIAIYLRGMIDSCPLPILVPIPNPLANLHVGGFQVVDHVVS